jgi:Ca2+-binding RTX toxin-like protein
VAGNDRLVGGLGNDTYIIDATGDTVTEALNAGTDTVQSAISYTLGANVENLALTGVSDLTANGNTLANFITGNSGNNLIDGGVGADTVNAAGGNDTVVYDASDVMMDGGSGADLLDVTGLAQLVNLAMAANLAGFEKIDLNNGGHTLNVSHAAIVALSDTDVLTVDGGAADTVTRPGRVALRR